MDEIRIEGLEIYAGHGVHEEENREGQIFLVNAVLYLDLREAGMTDDLTKSAHYGWVSSLMNDFLRNNTFQLIEAAAERTAEQVLLRFEQVQALDLEIEKPNAPMKLPFSSVSVKVHRGWKKVYLGIGSNMGDRKAYMDEAVRKLGAREKIRKLRTSAWIETEPYGGVPQGEFLNGAIEMETLYTPYELLKELQLLEAEAGRERIQHWGPRTLDLDILFFEDVISDKKELTIPHYDMQNRLFVLQPLNELCPYYMHPILHKSIKELLQELMRQSQT